MLHCELDEMENEKEEEFLWLRFNIRGAINKLNLNDRPRRTNLRPPHVVVQVAHYRAVPVEQLIAARVSISEPPVDDDDEAVDTGQDGTRGISQD